jgi:hypothetical protein
MNDQQKGVERLRMLLSGIQQPNIAGPSPISSIPIPELISPAIPAFDETSFRAHHQNNLQIILSLIKEQKQVENDLIFQFNEIKGKLNVIQMNIEAAEIVGDSRKRTELLKERLPLMKQQANHIQVIDATMQSLMLKQQQQLERAGFPLFKKSLHPDDLTDMYWVLQPYIAQLKNSN